MSFAALLVQTCTIQRATYPSEDDWGGAALVWANLATGVLCRISLARGREVSSADKQITVRSDRLYLPVGTGVTERDRIVLDSVTYQIVYVGEAIGRGAARTRYADLLRVT